MTTQPVSDPKTPIGEILKAVGAEGVLLESKELGTFALMPLDDDLIDYLIERNPRFRADCREIRGRTATGLSLTQDKVGRQLAEEG